MSAREERASPAREYAVEAVELTKRFGDFVAVDGGSFGVERGSIFGFLGPNGAGKTTTMRMLLGLQTTPQPDDITDALAICICHGYNSNNWGRRGE